MRRAVAELADVGIFKVDWIDDQLERRYKQFGWSYGVFESCLIKHYATVYVLDHLDEARNAKHPRLMFNNIVNDAYRHAITVMKERKPKPVTIAAKYHPKPQANTIKPLPYDSIYKGTDPLGH